jgi:serine/threonine protein kinase
MSRSEAEGRVGESAERVEPLGEVVAERYQILHPLGRGSFGHTWRARDRAAERDVAIKVLDPRGVTDWKAYELFEREAAVLRSLRHPGVPEVHELLRTDWRGSTVTLLVMEYVEGPSLERLIDEQRQIGADEALHLFDELLGILEYLHGRAPPVLHRDIKPSNIIVRPGGAPTLVDFGSVRRVAMGDEEAGSTVVGTYGYMPYEQYMGQATAASDLYALAATFLHLLTGRPPRDFMGEEGRIEVPDPLPGDPRLRPLLAQMLRPSPAERPGGARDVRRRLLTAPAALEGGRRALQRAPVGAPHPALQGPLPREVEGSLEGLLERAAPSMWEMMDSTNKAERWGALELLSVAFFSVATVGILPLVFASMARTRRRRVRRFLELGIPATAEIVGIRLETTAFDVKIARVGYEFEADGDLHRDVDQVLPVIADRWREGDLVQVLYLPDQAYDSVIIPR